MKVKFDFTLDDLVDAAERGAASSKLVRGWRWREMIVTAVLGGVIVYVLKAGSHDTKAVSAITGALIAAAIYSFAATRSRKGRLRKFFQERFGGEGPYPFEIDEAGEVFAYGRFECDSTVEYRSVIVFGRIRVVEDLKTRERFFDALMAKYAKKDWERPKGFYPRIDQITLYAIKIERMSGKETPLPADSQRWPAVDHTKSPDARA